LIPIIYGVITEKPTDNAGGDTTKKWKARWKTTRPIFVLDLVLTNLFQHGKNLTQASTSTEGGSQETCPPPNNPSSANVYMVRGDAFITTRAHDYSKPSASEKGKEVDLPSLPLQIEKMLGETMTRIPKGAFKKSSHNPNTRATQNYSVVEDLSQTSCAMSALEVLQSCSAQRKALLTCWSRPCFSPRAIFNF
jgi:hypothetical protein